MGKYSKREYDSYINSSAWRVKRKAVLERDQHRCTDCGSDEKLHVHHKTYVRFGNEDLDDLVTLCEDCHMKLHHERKVKEERRRARKTPRLKPGMCRWCRKQFSPKNYPGGGGWYCCKEHKKKAAKPLRSQLQPIRVRQSRKQPELLSGP